MWLDIGMDDELYVNGSLPYYQTRFGHVWIGSCQSNKLFGSSVIERLMRETEQPHSFVPYICRGCHILSSNKNDASNL